MRWRSAVAALVLTAATPAAAPALGPHEVLVLINGRSADSVEVGEHFARLRRVPGVNLVRLDVPESVSDSPSAISPEDFTRLIWEPALRAARERGIADHILAWAYSVDFPVRVGASPPVSIQGITFMRNRMPDADRIEKGTYASALFTGPASPDAGAHCSQSLDAYREWLGDAMPLPSMMLGYTGKRGTTKQTVLDCMERGVVSDGTAPSGTVYLVTGTDVRAASRQWQFPMVRAELQSLRVACVVASGFPEGREDVLGLMMGAAAVSPDRLGRFLPGSMAEHLTSFGAAFDHAGQTKLTAWLAAGATASAGTVAEPGAVWTKFPSARFFVHYAAGCCMLESFFQSIRCPLQILIVGEPLARPWAPEGELALHGVADGGDVAGTLTLRAEVRSKTAAHYGRFLYLVDGKTAGRRRELALDTTGLSNGRHTLRVVAYRAGLVRAQVFAEREIVVGNR